MWISSGFFLWIFEKESEKQICVFVDKSRDAFTDVCVLSCRSASFTSLKASTESVKKKEENRKQGDALRRYWLTWEGGNRKIGGSLGFSFQPQTQNNDTPGTTQNLSDCPLRRGAGLSFIWRQQDGGLTQQSQREKASKTGEGTSLSRGRNLKGQRV